MRVRRWNGWASWAYGFAKVLSVALLGLLGGGGVHWPVRGGAFPELGLPETQPALEGGEGYLGFAASGHTVGYYLARDPDHGPQLQLGLGLWPYDGAAIIRNVFVGLLAPSGGILFVTRLLHAVVSLATHSLWITQAFRLSGILFLSGL